jgi:hypothetical protein
MPPRKYRSPLTGDLWEDVRPAIGSLAGLAHYLNSKRPRRKPPAGVDEVIALTTEAVGAFAGLPRILKSGIVGTQVSDAYWKAKEATHRLAPLLDDQFRQCSRFWADWQDRPWNNSQEAPVVPHYLRAVRLAFWAASLTERAAASSIPLEMDDLNDVHYAWKGAMVELEHAKVDRQEAANVERVWRFVVAAGRMPGPGDADLLAAFEASVIAGEIDFARHLAAHGWGQRTDV